MPKQTWATVKSAASKLSQQELLGLVGEHYRLSSQNKAFMHARFAGQGIAIEKFKAIVAECLYPDVQRDRPLQVAKAKKAVADFCKAVAGPAAPVTFRKGVTPGLPFRRPAQTVAALDHRAHPAAD